MANYKQLFMDFCNNADIKFESISDHALRIVSNESNLKIPVIIIFDDENKALVEFKCFEIMRVVDVKQKAIEVCNKLNSRYRWVKYFVDDDGDVCCGADAYVTQTDCGEICMNTLIRFINITNEIYPEFAKIKFA